MISPEEATAIIGDTSHDFGTEETPLSEASGRILREDIFADGDLPPYDRVAMDGIAIAYDEYHHGGYKIMGMAAAGDKKQILTGVNACIEIMTGAILPEHADTVIPYEWLKIENGMATLIKTGIRKGQNVHTKGTDRKQGDLLIPSGKKISAAEIGILASTGKSIVTVSKPPHVLLVSTGNELIDIDAMPQEQQVRMSNVYQMEAALRILGILPDKIHLQDDAEEIRNALQKEIHGYDVMIISGGISAGKFDYIPRVLEEIGVRKLFFKVNQKPGKPFWFGAHDKCVAFGIPGNPVSSFMCFVRYIQPWLRKCMQSREGSLHASLSEDVFVKGELTNFMTVRLSQHASSAFIAHPVHGHGSGDFSILTDAHAFIELPAGRSVFRKGESFTVFPYREITEILSQSS